MGKAQDFFRSLSFADYTETLEGVNGTYRFDIQELGSIMIHVKNGKISASEKKGSADCVIGSTSEDFKRIAAGEQNLLTAAMQGRVTISGDLALAQRFYAITRTQVKKPTKKKKL